MRIARHGGVYLILNTWEAEASSFLCAGGQPGLPSKPLASQSLTVRLCLKTKQILRLTSSYEKHLASDLFSEGHTVVSRSPLGAEIQLMDRGGAPSRDAPRCIDREKASKPGKCVCSGRGLKTVFRSMF